MNTEALSVVAVRVAESPAQYSPAGSADLLPGIERRLQDAGLRVPLMRRGRELFAGGISVALDADGDGWRVSVADLCRAAAKNLPLSLHIGAAVDAGGLGDWLPVLLEVLSTKGSPLCLSVEAHSGHAAGIDALPTAAARLTRQFQFTDVRSRSVPGAGGQVKRHWLPALHAGVRSRCPLLPAEMSRTLLPASGLAVPARTAWVPLTLDLARYLDAAGDVDLPRLMQAVDVAVDCGDELHDILSWSGAAQTEDARVNRRLAISIIGIGDVVAARGADPSSLECLRDLDRLVAAMHNRAWQRSAALAAQKGPLPALAEKQPSAGWCDESHRRDWARRWRRAVENVQVRHRNLLALSPYALLPRTGTRSAASADLMPLLAYADVMAFAPPYAQWQALEIAGFQARMRAQVERLNATALIAASA